MHGGRGVGGRHAHRHGGGRVLLAGVGRFAGRILDVDVLVVATVDVRVERLVAVAGRRRAVPQRRRRRRRRRRGQQQRRRHRRRPPVRRQQRVDAERRETLDGFDDGRRDAGGGRHHHRRRRRRRHRVPARRFHVGRRRLHLEDGALRQHLIGDHHRRRRRKNKTQSTRPDDEGATEKRDHSFAQDTPSEDGTNQRPRRSSAF